MKNHRGAEIDASNGRPSAPPHLKSWFDESVVSTGDFPIVSLRCSRNDGTSLTTCGEIQFAEQGWGSVGRSGQFMLCLVEGDAVRQFLLDPDGTEKPSSAPRIGVASVNYEAVTGWRSSWSLFFLSFDPARVSEILPTLSYADLDGNWAYALNDSNEDLILAMKAARESFRANSRSSAAFRDSICRAVLPQFFSRCQELSALPGAEMTGLHKKDLQRVIEFVDANLSRKLTVPEIAQVLGMTPWHFSRAFKKSMGVAPYQYVLHRKIARAKDELRRSGTVALSELAIDLGFCDQTQFGLVFKKQTGMTPTEFSRLT